MSFANNNLSDENIDIEEETYICDRASDLPSDMLSMAGILLDGSKKPTNALLIIMVLLALENDLARKIGTYDMAYTSLLPSCHGK